MSKRSKSSLVYVHGTNGSGKSTLARHLVALAGGATTCVNVVADAKAFVTMTKERVDFLGRYDNACGGVDGYSPYAAIHDAVKLCLLADKSSRVFGEGLITPGVETCQRLADNFDQHLFIAMDVPEEQCIRNVLKRRATKGNDKPYDPANLLRKLASVQSWADRLEGAGLRVQRLDWRGAYLASAQRLGLGNIDNLL
jgi:energy-coupling factor transporter ATP-binding protein EcfA2